MGAEPQITLARSRWKDRHQKLADELTSWIANPDLRTATVNQVSECFDKERKAVGNLERWLRRTIQDVFFWKQIWGKEWTAEHDRFIEYCTSWIPDADIRSHVIGCFQEAFLENRDPPKKPSYWIRRIINPAFRKECKKRGIRPPNTWTEDLVARARTLAAQQGIREDVRDSIVSRVWNKLIIAVEPIENLEHWMNNVISTEFLTEITEATHDEGFTWPVLTQVAGTKQVVDKAVRDQENAGHETQGIMSDGEMGPLSPTPNLDLHLLLDHFFREHDKKSGWLGKLSRVVMKLCSEEVGYNLEEVGEFFDSDAKEIDDFVDHDFLELRLIAKELDVTAWPF